MVHHDSLSIDSADAISGTSNNFVIEGPSDFHKAQQLRFKTINFVLTCTNINETNHILVSNFATTLGSAKVYKRLTIQNYDPSALCTELEEVDGWVDHETDSAVTLSLGLVCNYDTNTKRFTLTQGGFGKIFYGRDYVKDSIKDKLINRYMGLDPKNITSTIATSGEFPYHYDLSYPKYITICSSALTGKSTTRHHAAGNRKSNILAKIPVNVQCGQTVNEHPYKMLHYVHNNSKNIDIQIYDDLGNPLPISPFTKVLILFDFFNTPIFVPY